MSGLLVLGLVLAVALALSFTLSGLEAGLPLLSRVRLRLRQRQGSASAGVLYRLVEQPEEYLWTILVGNTLANFGLLGAALFLLQGWLPGHRWAWLGAFAVVAFLLYALGDLLPKVLFRTYPHRLCLAVARPFQVIHLGLRPLVAPLAWLAHGWLRRTGGGRFRGSLFGSRDELRWQMERSAQALTREEQTLVKRVLDLQHRTVGSFMTPLAEVRVVSADQPVRECLREYRESGRDRWPVRGTAREELVGVVSLRTVLYREDLNPDGPVRAYMREVLRLEHWRRLEEALQRFQRSGHRCAVVVDRDRREVGWITLDDLLRPLFGEVTL